MKVGILTLPLHNNYGGMLQAAALYAYLSETGHQPVLLSKKFAKPYHVRLAGQVLRAIPGHDIGGTHSMEQERARHYPFLRAAMPERSPILHTLNDLQNYVRRAGLDAVIVGSDQVWRPDYVGEEDTRVFFLDFDASARKIAYAASFGKSVWTRPERLPEIRRMLNDFDAVSVREVSGAELCRTELQRERCAVTLDPTLLVDLEFYDRIAPNGNAAAEPYVLNYVLDPAPAMQAAGKEALGAVGGGRKEKTISLDDGSKTVTVPDWVNAFRGADFVVTDSFHGTIFSVLFGKPFVSIGNAERGLDRFTSLLGQLGLENRLVLNGDPESVRKIAATPVDYAPMRDKLAVLRTRSANFLAEALG
ncbi:polysaccharide pyruvyl transferase family protein [Hyphococcus sp.]|uniref:polysaccharide pyruvyl transferase family protein n=1 Tax=Hyphococcus sp. TaxID=2038636 RepID=UPI003D14422B